MAHQAYLGQTGTFEVSAGECLILGLFHGCSVFPPLFFFSPVGRSCEFLRGFQAFSSYFNGVLPSATVFIHLFIYLFRVMIRL